jgi:putative NADH-flavin reductase
MIVALIGATGNAGSRILAELVRRGHEVRALVRHPEKVPTREGVTACRVDANGKSGISYEDYAVALVDELEQPRHLRRRFTVGY